MTILFRRRFLGKVSCKGISGFMKETPTIVRNDSEVPLSIRHRGDALPFLFRWGCTNAIPEGYKVVNKVEAIALVSNKALFRSKLDEHNLAPKRHSLQSLVGEPRFDVIVRPRVHAQGKHTYRCKTPQELREAVRVCGQGYYISDYIPKVAEYRVFVAQGRAVWVARKTPANPNDIAWNVARGGSFSNVRWDEWPLKAVKTAIAAHAISGLDFSGVDVMLDAEGKVFVLEINAAPSQSSPYRQKCVAKAFDWIMEHGKEVIPLSDRRGDYKKFIHPAVAE